MKIVQANSVVDSLLYPFAETKVEDISFGLDSPNDSRKPTMASLISNESGEFLLSLADNSFVSKAKDSTEHKYLCGLTVYYLGKEFVSSSLFEGMPKLDAIELEILLLSYLKRISLSFDLPVKFNKEFVVSINKLLTYAERRRVIVDSYLYNGGPEEDKDIKEATTQKYELWFSPSISFYKALVKGALVVDGIDENIMNDAKQIARMLANKLRGL